MQHKLRAEIIKRNERAFCHHPDNMLLSSVWRAVMELGSIKSKPNGGAYPIKKISPLIKLQVTSGTSAAAYNLMERCWATALLLVVKPIQPLIIHKPVQWDPGHTQGLCCRLI